MRRFWLPCLYLSLALTSASFPVSAASLTALPSPNPSSSYSNVDGINANGSVIVGNTGDTMGMAVATYWLDGVAHTLDPLPYGYPVTYAHGVNRDGSVIVGVSYNALARYQAVSWTNGAIYELGNLPGDIFNEAFKVNDDGSVIVGYSLNGSFNRHAVSWVNGNIQDLGYLPGASYTESQANDINGDGTKIVGYSYNSDGYQQGVRWVNGTIEALDSLAVPMGNYSFGTANAISKDGNIIVGQSVDAAGFNQAVRWVNGTAVQSLGFLTGYTDSSNALALNRDGSVIVGFSANGGTQQAVRWVNGGNAESLADILAGKNVDLTGWQLNDARGVSDNGEIITGNAIYNSGSVGYIANIVTGGVTTPVDLGQSLVTVSQVGNQAVAITGLQLGQSLFQARNLIPANVFALSSAPSSSAPATSLNDMPSSAGGPYRTLWQIYTTGSVGYGQNNDFDNHDLNGTIGIKAQVTPSIALGGGVIGSTARSSLAFEGNSKLEALGLSGIAAYAPVDSGLRLYGSVFAADLSLDIRRGYTNGAGLDSSLGKTDGFAYGTAAQIGWNMPVTTRYSIMPYIEGRWSHTKIDGYNENGGAFAASFGSQNVNNTTARVGLENNYLIRDNLNLLGRLAIAHRLNGEGSGVTANISGLTQTLGNEMGDKTWGEATVGLGWQMSERTYLSTELNARSGDTPEPQLSATIGISVRF